MNLKTIGLIFLVCIILFSCKSKSSLHQKTAAQTQIIFPKGDKITNNNFTGTVYLKMLLAHDSSNPTAIGNVTFEPGARTNWHFHPDGQILLVTDGVGYYQEKGQPKKNLKIGDVVKCPPNVPHWHGATEDSKMTHLAITTFTGEEQVKWLQPVTDKEYNAEK